MLATVLAKLLQKQTANKTTTVHRLRRGFAPLHGPTGRKYLNREERRRLLDAIGRASPPIRLFCLVLIWGGCRISEALALTPTHIDLEGGVVEFETLKRRRNGLVRQVPMPPEVLRELERVFDLSAAQRDPVRAVQRLWPWSRSTAWRHVKTLMANAEVYGSAAMPKGLRHTFGVAAFLAVPPHLVQRWLGHASLRTTAIYGDVSGPEERHFAERVWRSW
jgi:integrase/recombinase XerD